MAILNIYQFSERQIAEIRLCKICSGKMEETHINTLDAIKYIFGKKKIIRRYKCNDCNNEIKIEK